MRGFVEPAVDPIIRAIEARIPSVLEQYCCDDHSWKPLSNGENVTVRVFSPGGTADAEPSFVLRFHAPDRSDIPRVMTEMLWLAALRKDKFPVPEPQRTRDGEFVAHVPLENDRRVATLLTWVPGRSESDRRSTPMLHQVGEFIGHLHEHSRRFSLGTDCQPNQWDFDGLFGPQSPMAAGWKLLDGPRRELFLAVTENFRCVSGDLGQSPDAFGLIHADLHFGNVLFADTEVRAIDFDDCGLGYWLYDIAVTLETLEERPDYLWLRTALIEGYRKVQPFSQTHERFLDAFIAARRVLLILWLLCRLDHPSLKKLFTPYVRVALPRLVAFAEKLPARSR